MKYLALGDSISIDKYTGVARGGAASQLSRMLPASQFQNLTEDGRTTGGVVQSLRQVEFWPDVVTVTAGGNDLLQTLIAWRMGGPHPEQAVHRILGNLNTIVGQSAFADAQVILNTVYDPTDGSDLYAGEMGLPDWARRVFALLNDGIRALAKHRQVMLCDLEELFHGHGFWSKDPWIVSHIEPNLKGASAMALTWHRMLTAK